MKLLDVSGLIDEIGKDCFFSDKKTALEALTKQFGTNSSSQDDDAPEENASADNIQADDDKDAKQ